jgi:hypothetical protein
MEVVIISQGLNDEPKLDTLTQPIIDLTSNERMIFCVIEEGMSSGEPSVIIVSETEEGSVCIQTSLEKIISAVEGMMASAEARWDWKRPEGNFSIGPMPKEARRVMLESIKNELEEWDRIEEEISNGYESNPDN